MAILEKVKNFKKKSKAIYDLRKSFLMSEERNSVLDTKTIQNVLVKANELRVLIHNYINKERKQDFCPKYTEMCESTDKMMNLILQNSDYIKGTDIFYEDFSLSISIIQTAYESYVKSMNYIAEIQKTDVIQTLQVSIDIFAQSIMVFSSIIEEIMNQIAESKETTRNIIKIRLGLESSLFNFSVSIEPISEAPFFKSRFVEIYKLYNIISDSTDHLLSIKSVCGSGKTLCLPIILLCKSLRDNMNAPFLILTQPGPKNIESKEPFFSKTISKYVDILLDDNDLYNEYEHSKKIRKVIFAILLPQKLLTLMHKLQKNEIFYQNTRFVIDEVHQRSFYLDVLINQFGNLSQNPETFPLPLNVILMSADIPLQLLNPFNDTIKKMKLIKSPPFEIIERKAIIESYIPKINKEIVRDQTINVIQEMSQQNSEIEEGHILCFFASTGNCYKLKKSVSSILKNSEETENQRKIVILETTLKPNEKIESYFTRLEEEFLLNESLREANNYKNDFLYFVPIIVSGNVDDLIFKLAQNEFPSNLKKINKLICSTPMIESSFYIDKLSVVIDSGLVKEGKFDTSTCLTTLKEKQASRELMNQRKGRLGKSMKGLYISIHAPDEKIARFKSPYVKRNDLTTNILLIKDIGIDFEDIKNLPDKPNQQNLKFSIGTLIKMGAIDPYTKKITEFGHELLKYVCFPIIDVYYAAATANFSKSFPKEEKNIATFFAAFITTMISMCDILLYKEMTEKMSREFDEESDITTIVNSLRKIMNNEPNDNDKLRDFVESYGFSYTSYLVFKNHLQKIVELLSPESSTLDYIANMEGFINKYDGVSFLIDRLIPEIAKVSPNWKSLHSIKMKYVSGTGGFDSFPSIVFNCDQRLMFENSHQKTAEIRITKRPGWNGIIIPTECYCFQIKRNADFNTNYGYLIHRMNRKSKGEIVSIECDKVALNPWFDVLLDTYLAESSLNVKYFTNKIKSTSDPTKFIIEKRMFHYSMAGERVFVSFIPYDNKVKQIVMDSIDKCLKLMPFTPRSIIIPRKDVKAAVEITSIGTQHYDTSISTSVPFKPLDRSLIDFCLNNLKELAKSESSMRICAIFTKQTCESEFLDMKQLYLINTNANNWPNLLTVVLKRIDDIKKFQRMEDHRNLKHKSHNSSKKKLVYFKFPPKFIHPALMFQRESRACILNWFKNHCDYAHVIKVIGSNFLMTEQGVKNLQAHLRNEKEKIIQDMNLNYATIRVPKKIYSKAYLVIKQHPTWNYINRFNVIITTKEEAEEANKLINSIKEELQDENDDYMNTLCCIYVCDPDNPSLTKYPITIYNQDGTTYQNKMCRDCIVDTLQNATESYFSNDEIDYDAINKISLKPAAIASVESKETNDGLESWPQIPFGQMISALINNDDELSHLATAWLQGISEYEIRVQARNQFTFCPDHPDYIFNLNLRGPKGFKCKDPNCKNIYCDFCLCWHNPNYVCDEKKSGKKLTWNKMCPKCKVLTFKDGGCNHISCPCGCHWCYKCGEGFSTADKCYSHLTKKHGGCFDY